MGENKSDLANQSVLLGTLMGAVTGAAIALMWAPKSGREMRQDLNHNASLLRDRASDWKNAAYDKGSKLTETACQKSSELKEKAYLKGSEVRTKAVDSTIDLSKKTQQKTQELATNIQGKRNNDSAADQAAAANEGEGAAEDP